MNSCLVLLVLSLLHAAPAQAAPEAPVETITLPAGTEMELTVVKSIKADADVVSLEIAVPLEIGGRRVIPEKTEVLGYVETTKRYRNGERDHARLRMREMIFPNGYAVNMVGTVDKLPHIPSNRMRVDGQDVALATAIMLAIPTAFGLGPGVVAASAGGTAGTGVGLMLLTRGAPVWLRQGQHMGMVLDDPLTLKPARIEQPQ